MQVLPLVIPVAYFMILPRPAAFADMDLPPAYDDETIGAPVTSPYTPLPTSDDDDNASNMEPKRSVALSARDKWHLVKPLMSVYMLPLCEFHVNLLSSLVLIVFDSCRIYCGCMFARIIPNYSLDIHSWSTLLIK